MLGHFVPKQKHTKTIEEQYQLKDNFFVISSQTNSIKCLLRNFHKLFSHLILIVFAGFYEQFRQENRRLQGCEQQISIITL